jgi:hypothetical protein
MPRRYSTLMNFVFVTFMYGLFIPILFPIALLFLLIMYIMTKLLITYYYRKPPMYDNLLNDSALNMIKWAPVFMLLFGYWAFGNKQMFENHLVPK